MYLLLKSSIVQNGESSPDVDSHPVMLNLKVSNALKEKLKRDVVAKAEHLLDQVDNLVRASSLLSDSREVLHRKTATGRVSIVREIHAHDTANESVTAKSVTPSQEPDSRQGILNEVKFGLRQNEIYKRHKNNGHRHSVISDLGDSHENATTPGSLAAYINAIDQRAAANILKGKRIIPSDESEFVEDTFEVTAGIRMMEDELEGAHHTNLFPGFVAGNGGNADEREKLDDSTFYNKIAGKVAEKKQMKANIHSVSPKFPKFEAEVAGERAISKTILKNRGLVPHKAKINRNPRVKKRLQYRKALIRRKGAIREVRTGEGNKYDGEETGIKSKITRSRKLAP